MNKGNLILLVVLAAVAGVWLLGRDWGGDEPTGPAPRLFPEFNKEAADAIEISGGWQGTSWGFAREGSDWTLASAGGYPVKADEVDRFVDAVANLRRDNPVGTSADLRARSHTDEKNGRLVRVLRGGEPMAEFYVGKTPQREYQACFVRKAEEDAVYRSRTLLTKDREKELSDDPMATGPTGFDWHNYVNSLSSKWVDTEIWDLGNAEAEEIWITRAGSYEVKLLKRAQDRWELVEGGGEPVAADADAADGMLSRVRRLNLVEVLGAYDDVAAEYGLDKPEVTLVLKLKKKIERKEEPQEGEEKKEDEYQTLHRIVEVGKKVSRPRYDGYTDEMKSTDYYAIHVGPAKDMDDPAEAKRAGFVFLVDSYTAGELRKDLDDLKAKPEEEEEQATTPGEEEGAVPPPGEGEGDEKAPPPPGEGDDEGTGAEKPGGDTEQPGGETEKPGGETEQPGGETEKPGGETEQPGDETEKPGDEDSGCAGGEDEGCGS